MILIIPIKLEEDEYVDLAELELNGFPMLSLLTAIVHAKLFSNLEFSFSDWYANAFSKHLNPLFTEYMDYLELTHEELFPFVKALATKVYSTILFYNSSGLGHYQTNYANCSVISFNQTALLMRLN